MGIETKRREIGSITFEVTQLQYFRAQRLLVRFGFHWLIASAGMVVDLIQG